MRVWKTIHPETGYSVSNDGLVRLDVDRQHGNKLKAGSLMAQSPDSDGYMIVGVRLNGARRTARVHQLAYEAHVGPIPDGLTINHEDGDTMNNCVTNLTLMTIGDNVRHSVHVLGHRLGEDNANAQLTDVEVLSARSRAANGDLFTDIAADLGVTITHVSALVRGEQRVRAGGPISAKRDAIERKRLGILNHRPGAKRPGVSGGEKNPKAKMTSAKVVSMRERAAAGEGFTALARDPKFDVTPATAWSIITGRTWPNAGGPIRA